MSLAQISLTTSEIRVGTTKKSEKTNPSPIESGCIKPSPPNAIAVTNIIGINANRPIPFNANHGAMKSPKRGASSHRAATTMMQEINRNVWNCGCVSFLFTANT